MLADERLRALLAMRSRVKELSEACSVCEQVRALVGADTVAAGGEGAVVLDVCSGKGLGATLLSYMLPKGRVVMLDANGEMELAHVAARPNLSFRHADIFSAQLPAVVREEAAGAKADEENARTESENGKMGAAAMPGNEKRRVGLSNLSNLGDGAKRGAPRPAARRPAPMARNFYF